MAEKIYKKNPNSTDEQQQQHRKSMKKKKIRRNTSTFYYDYFTNTDTNSNTNENLQLNNDNDAELNNQKKLSNTKINKRQHYNTICCTNTSNDKQFYSSLVADNDDNDDDDDDRATETLINTKEIDETDSVFTDDSSKSSILVPSIGSNTGANYIINGIGGEGAAAPAPTDIITTNSNDLNIDNNIKQSYVQQLKMKFEKIYKNNSNHSTEPIVDNNMNTDNIVKRKISSFRSRRRGKPLSEHLNKVLPWHNNNNHNNNHNSYDQSSSNSINIMENSKKSNQNYENMNKKGNDYQNDKLEMILSSLPVINIPEILPIIKNGNNKNKNIEDATQYTEYSNLIDSFGEEEDEDDEEEEEGGAAIAIGIEAKEEQFYSEDHVTDSKQLIAISDNHQNVTKKPKNRKSFKRSLNRPKTEVFEAKNRNITVLKSHSYHPEISTPELTETTSNTIQKIENDFESAAITDLKKQFNFTLNLNNSPPIIEEILRTEQKYVENLYKNLVIYGDIFENANQLQLPTNLLGKKYILFGNIEEIYELHSKVLLPMLQLNRNNYEKMFNEFLQLIEDDQFYGYILYTINKKKSLKLCEQHADYFRELQQKTDDKLGIHSFLVQPIQRLARYPLLLQEFYKTCFGDKNLRQAVASCCKLEKKMRQLLDIVNDCEEINDIEDCFDINIFYQGRFKKVNEFQIHDYTLKRSYRSKVFIFEKCLLYTEIKDKRLIYRGHYPCDMIGFVAKQKSFTLYFEKRKIQECDFEADHLILEQWIELIRDMIKIYAIEEKRKLNEKYSTTNQKLLQNHTNNNLQQIDILRHPTINYEQHLNKSRISADSGYSGMTIDETILPKTTWYDTL